MVREPGLTSQFARRPIADADVQALRRLDIDRLRTLLATRTTQTNEVGRCAIFLPAFGLLADEVGSLGHLDVGASGGLNLLADRYEYHYESADGVVATVGGPSPVVLRTATTGALPVPASMPVIAARCGVDQRPIDVTDDAEAVGWRPVSGPTSPTVSTGWWRRSTIARRRPPEILAGDAVASLAPAIERIGSAAHPVVTNSWVLNYLTSQARSRLPRRSSSGSAPNVTSRGSMPKPRH